MIRLKLNRGASSPDSRKSTSTTASPPNLPKIKVKQPRKGRSTSGVASSPPSQLATPRISIKPPLVRPSGPARHGLPRIRVKPVRQPGQGYDSEAPDREDDPLIEEGLIFRFEMDSFSLEEQRYRERYLEILRSAVDGQGTEFGEVWIKFKDPRHAAVGIRDKLFFAVLVDLPTIIEAQKSLDRKNIYKVADICQMLLVLDEIVSEEQVVGFRSRILPDSELQKPENKGNRKEELPYPHGITPPMRFARSGRFRKRIVKAVEPEQPKLKEKPIPKVIIRTKPKPEEGAELDREEETDDHHEGHREATEELPQTPEAHSAREPSVALSDADAGYNMLGGYNQEEATDAGDEIESLFGNESDEEEEEDEEDEDEDEDDEDAKKRGGKMDDEEIEALHHLELLKEEIAELESTIESKERDAENATNPILRNRFLDVVNKLRKELALKKAELEDGNEEE
ncbi:TAFII55 protein conserved region-domain-containing protein [Lipomyces tetrasporus]|uniref:TAFII55 protein conserved region-domain-containing protein n=1 Tax=Lipomyces tetrasporus TaxID=54092 RepID=A0AAD7QQH7_9ASCO|nr:TAFII55 protein conserved region-domain-containing protein [Lipomyces tetrasporus]KAJ8097997.1 TAFII55 protein conserved region-domain-containing protein [Lipomyces tetrasporus]